MKIEPGFFESLPASKQSNSNRKKIYGFGINDAEFITQVGINGKKYMHPAYDCWKQIIRRCHARESLDKKPHYALVSVCEEWASFSSFHSWWKENQVDGWQVDKDLLTDLKLYSPTTCIFIPKWLNTFLTDAKSARGLLPIGVTFNKKGSRYEAHCQNQSIGKQEYLGAFDNPNDAHLAWKSKKIEHADRRRREMDEIDERIYPRVIHLINNPR